MHTISSLYLRSNFSVSGTVLYLQYVTKSLQQPSEIGAIILHFTDKEIEPERAPVTCLSSHSLQVAELDLAQRF